MAADYYETLGVARTATADDIRKAYRQLARRYHPDLNPNDAKAKEQFQEVQSAFDVLNDPKKREMYDRYGSAYESVGAGARGPNPWAGAGGGANVDIDLEELFGGGGGFADLFRQFGQRGKRQQPRRDVPTRGANIEHELTVPFTTAVLGGEAQIGIQRADGHVDALQVKIPAGIEDGKRIRLRGQGEPSLDGGPAGDLLIKVIAAPHPHFRRHGKQLEVRVPVTLAEALRGGKVDVPTPHGVITLTVPPGTSGGKKLRVKGQGVIPTSGEPGDLLAEIQVELPANLSAEDGESIAAQLDKYHDNPRTDLRW